MNLLALFLAAAVPGLPVRFDTIAINLSNVGRKGPSRLEIVVERWSTDEERDRLRDALIEKGPDALLDAVQKIKPRVGFIRGEGQLGWSLQYAREIPVSTGGRRIVFATDRPMTFQEVAAEARSKDYAFMLGELRVRPDGKGEGKLVPRAKITYNKDDRTIEIEDYASEPVRLGEVTTSKP